MAQYINRNAPGAGLASLMAARGRGGDTELVHMTRPEVKRLEASGLMSLNPQTGLPEYFLGGLKNFAKSLVKPRNLAALAAGIMFGPAIYGAIGGAMGTGLFGTLATGALGGAAVGGLTGAIAGQDIPKSIVFGGGTGLAGSAVGYGTGKWADSRALARGHQAQKVIDANKYRQQVAGVYPEKLAEISNMPVSELQTAVQRSDAISKMATQQPDILKKIGITNLPPQSVRTAAFTPVSPETIRSSIQGPGSAGYYDVASRIPGGGIPTPGAVRKARLGTDLFSARTPIQSMKNVGKYYEQSPSKLLSVPSQVLTTRALVEEDEAAEERQKKQEKAMLAGSQRETYTQKDRKYRQPSLRSDPPTLEATLARYYGGIGSGDWGGRWYGSLSGKDIYPDVIAKRGGLVSLEKGGRAFEGKVEGPGHGMQDNVMMPIEGGGIAAVSPKEYVVPADVMAMLGNGNADDGSEKMDRFISTFRKTKYGRDRQPPEMDGSTALQSLIKA